MNCAAEPGSAEGLDCCSHGRLLSCGEWISSVASTTPVPRRNNASASDNIAVRRLMNPQLRNRKQHSRAAIARWVSVSRARGAHHDQSDTLSVGEIGSAGYI